MHERAVGPLGFRILQQRQQAAAFDLFLHFVGQLRAGDLGERREKVEMGAQRIALRAARDAASGPAEEARRARAALIGVPLPPFMPALKIFTARGAAVVGAEIDDQRVVRDAPFVELLQQLAEVRVDVLDHAEELRGVLVHAGLAEILLVVFLGQDVRPVRGVERDVGEERLLRLALRIHPLDGLAEKQVGAVARGLLQFPVVPERGIDVRVAGRVAAGAGIGLPDAAAAVDIDFVKAAALRAIRLLVAEMPFAEDAGRVANGLQHLRQA